MQIYRNQREEHMGMMTIRNIPDEIHKGLRERARRNKRSAEAEVRAILEEAIQPQAPLRMGDALAGLGKKWGLTDEDLDAIANSRVRTTVEPIRFEE